MTKIYINGRFLTQPITGVQRYAHEVLRHIDDLITINHSYAELDIVCLVPPETLVKPIWKKISIRSVGAMKGNLWEQFDLPRYLDGQLLFSPANIGPWHYTNQIVTLHDASVFAFPEAYSFAFRTKYKYIFRQLVKNTKRLITDSKFSQNELARYLQVSPERFCVIHLGSDHLESIPVTPDILRRKNLISKSYLLLVASRSRHKNYEVVVQAAKFLGKTVKMVAVGGTYGGVFQNSTSIGCPTNIENLGYVSDQELIALYQNALGFIFPSLYEGFGLPVLEAMRSGCPVISSTAASMREIAGDAVLYFDPNSANDLTNVIQRFVSDSDLQEELRNKGYRRSEKFTWSKTARETLERLLKAL